MANNRLKNKKPVLPVDDDRQGRYFGIFLLILLSVILFLVFSNRPNLTVLTYTSFLKHLKADSLSSVVIQGQVVHGEFKEAIGGVKEFKTVLPLDDRELLPLLKTHNVEVTGKEVRESGSGTIWWILGISAVMFIVWIFILRGMQGGDPGKAVSFGRSKARLN